MSLLQDHTRKTYWHEDVADLLAQMTRAFAAGFLFTSGGLFAIYLFGTLSVVLKAS